MAKPFSAIVGAWAEKVPQAIEIVFKEAAQEIVEQLGQLVPRDTGFLRSSLMASTTAMPTLNRPKGVPSDLGDVMLVIAGADIGDTLYLGYTANYAAFVHFGAQGRQPRPWVTMVAQRWEMIVADKAREVKARLGL